jgi:hypothetical protein
MPHGHPQSHWLLVRVHVHLLNPWPSSLAPFGKWLVSRVEVSNCPKKTLAVQRRTTWQCSLAFHASVQKWGKKSRANSCWNLYTLLNSFTRHSILVNEEKWKEVIFGWILCSPIRTIWQLIIKEERKDTRERTLFVHYLAAAERWRYSRQWICLAAICLMLSINLINEPLYPVSVNAILF